MKQVYRLPDGEVREVEIERTGDRSARVRIGDWEREVAIEPIAPGRFRVVDSSGAARATVDANGAHRHVTVSGLGSIVLEKEVAGRRRRREQAPGSHASPMPGTVVKVLVAPGDQVDAGQDLVIVEAMKMEIKVSAQIEGTVKSVPVEAGQPCDAGQMLAEIEADES